jgi:hypothetical protein
VKYYRVTHHHTAYIEADCAYDAECDCALQVRENAEAGECESEEISEQEFNDHWDAMMNEQQANRPEGEQE